MSLPSFSGDAPPTSENWYSLLSQAPLVRNILTIFLIYRLLNSYAFTSALGAAFLAQQREPTMLTASCLSHHCYILVMWLADIAQTLPQEIDAIWARKLNSTSALYFLNRYGALVSLFLQWATTCRGKSSDL